MKPEILAPAGSFEALTAAVRNGADAVYFGTGNYNARKNATNFDGDELERAIDFCHLHGVKCHIALNTLVNDNEIEDLIKTVKRTCELSADALILQDLGVAKIVRSICPDIQLHASTQLSTGTPEGLNLLKELGFSRAVLPRELSFNEIKAITACSPIETEVFVHGALCMCVSGQCLMSAMLGSRSGNRGLCAQPCRLPFKADGGTGNDLSLKDLSLIEEINLLNEAGVCSFKIEGRMKRPEYVAAAVSACRSSVDRLYNIKQKDELEALFSRSGFTKGYFESKTGREMFGCREKENVTAATNELLNKYKHTYEKEKPIYKVDFTFSADEKAFPELIAECNDHTVRVTSDTICEKAKKRPLDSETVAAQLHKCGGTVFEAGNIQCLLGETVSLPLSAINAMRREALDELSAAISQKKNYPINDYKVDCIKHTASSAKTYCLFYNENEIPDNIKADKVFVPLDSKPDIIKKYGYVFIPRGIFGKSDIVLEKLKKSGARGVLCNTPDAVAIAKKTGAEIIGGPFLNVFNTFAVNEYYALGVKEITLSYELNVGQLSAIGGTANRGCVVYGRTPLMLTRNCPVKNGKTCSECNKHGFITDRLSIKFPVICCNGYSEILNSRPTYMADRLNEIHNMDYHMFVFTDESKSEAEKVLLRYKNGEKPQGEFTRGLFYRGVE